MHGARTEFQVQLRKLEVNARSIQPAGAQHEEFIRQDSTALLDHPCIQQDSPPAGLLHVALQ